MDLYAEMMEFLSVFQIVQSQNAPGST